jgi:RNase P subunit RPR2
MDEKDFYKEIEYYELDKELDEISYKTKYAKFEDLFELKCKKCNSPAMLIDYNDIGHGSEYTGTWGDAGIVIKCKNCGNAIKIKVVDN